ncbi:MAG: hypothetical protein LBK54_06600 [Propionibacteriaceae bacterium]|jgi:hypothetical protein|nr:hypothetical protein [Propionibacteriaceae bacterium]
MATMSKRALERLTRQTGLAEVWLAVPRQMTRLARPQSWRAWLTAAGRFPDLSFENTVLLQTVRPDATRIASRRRWQELGRTVRRGQIPITLLAPVPTGAAAGPYGTGTPAHVLVQVFDVAQTTGQPLPDARPTRLDGPDPAETLWRSLASDIEAQGFHVKRGPQDGPHLPPDRRTREVTIPDGLPPAEAALALAHQAAAVLSIPPVDDWTPPAEGCSGYDHFIAESAAIMACARAGVDAPTNPLPPIRRVARETLDAGLDIEDVVSGTARRVHQIASHLVQTTDANPSTDLVDRLNELTIRLAPADPTGPTVQAWGQPFDHSYQPHRFETPERPGPEL